MNSEILKLANIYQIRFANFLADIENILNASGNLISNLSKDLMAIRPNIEEDEARVLILNALRKAMYNDELEIFIKILKSTSHEESRQKIVNYWVNEMLPYQNIYCPKERIYEELTIAAVHNESLISQRIFLNYKGKPKLETKNLLDFPIENKKKDKFGTYKKRKWN